LDCRRDGNVKIAIALRQLGALGLGNSSCPDRRFPAKSLAAAELRYWPVPIAGRACVGVCQRISERIAMRGILMLVVIVGILIAAGVLSVSWGDGGATVKINKEKARERGQQVLEEAHKIESNFGNSLEQPK
jgi:hypothetical protein